MHNIRTLRQIRLIYPQRVVAFEQKFRGAENLAAGEGKDAVGHVGGGLQVKTDGAGTGVIGK
jgi:hypothetical protein